MNETETNYQIEEKREGDYYLVFTNPNQDHTKEEFRKMARHNDMPLRLVQVETTVLETARQRERGRGGMEM